MLALLKKELQSFFFSPFAYVLTALFMFIFAVALVIQISNVGSELLKFSFPNMFYNNFFYFIFIIPILTMRSFADERRGSTEVLLISSPLSVTKIVIAKFIAIVIVFLFMVTASLFYPITLAAMGGDIIWSSLFCAYAGFFMWGLVCIAVGMLVSSFTENAIIAAIIGEILMEGLLFLDQWASSGLVNHYRGLYSVVTWFSMQRRFVHFYQGLFRLDDLVFFLCATAVILFWNIMNIERRRWTRN